MSLNLSSYDVPNRFSVYDANNNLVAYSGWMGYATYSGPWGMSLNTQQSKVISFVMNCSASSTYTLKVETSTQNYSDAWDASISCSAPKNVSISAENDQATRDTMIARFNNLQVNWSALSTELGLSYTLNASNIDFNNLNRSYITNDCDDGEGIVANFYSNSSSTEKYAFFLSRDPGKIEYVKPMIVKVIPNQQKKYFDLEEGYIATINNYSSSSISTQVTTGAYMLAAPPPGGCGQATMNCLIDAYSNHGWLSVWATLQSAYIPETGVALAAACALKNCRKRSIQ